MAGLVEVAGRVVGDGPTGTRPWFCSMLQERVELEELIVGVVDSTW